MVAFLTRGRSGNPCKCCTTELHIEDSTECTVALIIQTEHVHQLLARRFCNLQAVKDSGQRVTGRGGLQRAISGRQVVHDRVLLTSDTIPCNCLCPTKAATTQRNFSTNKSKQNIATPPTFHPRTCSTSSCPNHKTASWRREHDKRMPVTAARIALQGAHQHEWQHTTAARRAMEGHWH